MAELMKRITFEATEVLASTTETATAAGDAVRLQSQVNALGFTLDVTDADAAGGDTLDVYVQTKLDASDWTDVVHFTQVLGNGGAVRHIARVSAGLAQTMFAVSAALTAGNVRHLLGDEWRVRWVVSGGTAEFTFSVVAVPA